LIRTLRYITLKIQYPDFEKIMHIFAIRKLR